MLLLNLSAYEVLKYEELTSYIILLLKPKPHNQLCPYCNSSTSYKYGYKSASYADLPIRAKRVSLTIKLQRYKCKSCGKIYQDDTPEMSDNYRMTKRLEFYIKQRASLSTFTKLADEIGITEGSVRKIFADSRKSRVAQAVTPIIMGIDEIYICGKPRCVITDIEKRTVVDMLPDRNKTTVIRYLSNLKEKHTIEYVAMDMWRPYKDAVKECLPNAQIVVDKFHVVRMANAAVEMCRKEIRKSLASKQRLDLKNDRFILARREHTLNFNQALSLSYWRENYPALGKTHMAKELFYGIYDAQSKAEAYERYAEFECVLTSEVKRYYEPLITSIQNWHEEIFAYFDQPITNAYTESLNSMIRHIDRLGRGHSFETIRAKVIEAPKEKRLLGEKPRVVKRFVSSTMVATNLYQA